jgi:rSAM/selenodomain-associated transferase 2
VRISIIIPTYNEANNICKLVEHLSVHLGKSVCEIIIVDGGSKDKTVEVAQCSQATVLVSEKKGRAAQMNFGASKAKGDILYFVHADSIPPLSFPEDIKESLADGYQLGCYRFKFRSKRRILKINSYFTRFDRLMCRGGDQTLFIPKTLFNELGGYREDYIIMEDYEFLIRARKQAKFRIMPKAVSVSARKYDTNSYLRVNVANLTVFTMYRFGSSPQKMRNTYVKMLHHPKSRY